MISAGARVQAAAWSYPKPTEAFLSLCDYVSFYPKAMDACFVDDEQARPSRAASTAAGSRQISSVRPRKSPVHRAGEINSREAEAWLDTDVRCWRAPEAAARNREV